MTPVKKFQALLAEFLDSAWSEFDAANEPIDPPKTDEELRAVKARFSRERIRAGMVGIAEDVLGLPKARAETAFDFFLDHWFRRKCDYSDHLLFNDFAIQALVDAYYRNTPNEAFVEAAKEAGCEFIRLPSGRTIVSHGDQDFVLDSVAEGSINVLCDNHMRETLNIDEFREALGLPERESPQPREAQ